MQALAWQICWGNLHILHQCHKSPQWCLKMQWGLDEAGILSSAVSSSIPLTVRGFCTNLCSEHKWPCVTSMATLTWSMLLHRRLKKLPEAALKVYQHLSLGEGHHLGWHIKTTGKEQLWCAEPSVPCWPCLGTHIYLDTTLFPSH